MEKVVIDENKCIGCGACVALAGNTFEFGQGCSKVIDPTPTEEVKNIIDSYVCPCQAISIVEVEEEEQEDTAA